MSEPPPNPTGKGAVAPPNPTGKTSAPPPNPSAAPPNPTGKTPTPPPNPTGKKTPTPTPTPPPNPTGKASATPTGKTPPPNPTGKASSTPPPNPTGKGSAAPTGKTPATPPPNPTGVTNPTGKGPAPTPPSGSPAEKAPTPPVQSTGTKGELPEPAKADGPPPPPEEAPKVTGAKTPGSAVDAGMLSMRKAMVMAASYVNTVEQIPGRERAAEGVERMLNEAGFTGEMLTLRDDKPDMMPSRQATTSGLWWLAEQVREGDAVWLSFTGQAILLPERGSGFRKEHAFCCDDYRHNGPLTADDVHELFLKKLPANVWVTILCDFHHGGCITDLPYILRYCGNDEMEELEDPTRTALPSIDITMISTEGSNDGGRGLTDAFIHVVNDFKGKPLPCRKLLSELKAKLSNGQSPVITSSKKRQLDDYFHLGAPSLEAHKQLKRAVQVPLCSVMNDALTHDESGRHVMEILQKNQRTAHAKMQMVLESGVEAIKSEMERMTATYQQRREFDEKRLQKETELWARDQAASENHDEKWRDIMKSMVERSDDTVRKEEHAKWSRRITTATRMLEDEKVKLEIEKSESRRKKRELMKEMDVRWEATLQNLKSLTEQPLEQLPEHSTVETVPVAQPPSPAKEQSEDTLSGLPQLPQLVVDAVTRAGASAYLPKMRLAELDEHSFALLSSSDFLQIGVKELGHRIKLNAEAKKMKVLLDC
eukprot:TRINITY_DN36858_c0_g1_i1.p1 TRINITY_DN36858_c0_g1~~TRINITY_DN36858_c0_g1_i1.p1  ORF type:complete len:734 (+),score=197.05 TRINITY_DN36858_c0_g1_i1:81-2204(+)